MVLIEPGELYNANFIFLDLLSTYSPSTTQPNESVGITVVATAFLIRFLVLQDFGHFSKALLEDLRKVLIHLGISWTTGFLEPFLQRSFFPIFLTNASIVGHVCAPMFLAKVTVFACATLPW